MTQPIITLTTDFGLADSFVGAMKGVILGIAPEAVIVDISHEVPAQNIVAGALALESVVDYFPAGSIHVAVVDPGVGTERAAIAVETERFVCVAPDNGILALALGRSPLIRAVRIRNHKYGIHPASSTFHGRDVFAPAGAHLATGVPLEALGEAASALATLDLPQPVELGHSLEAHVIHIDRFGNLVTDLTAKQFAEWQGDSSLLLRFCGWECLSLARTYADAQRGQPLAYFGSGGRLEIGVREGSAQEWFEADTGWALTLERLG